MVANSTNILGSRARWCFTAAVNVWLVAATVGAQELLCQRYVLKTLTKNNSEKIFLLDSELGMAWEMVPSPAGPYILISIPFIDDSTHYATSPSKLPLYYHKSTFFPEKH